MKHNNIRENLISSGRAREYLKQRKKYFDEEVKETTTLKDNHIINILTDKENGKIVAFRNWERPARPEYFGMTEEELSEAEKQRNATRRQVKRIKAHISFLLKQPDYFVFFLTLTFTDNALSRTTEETRKQTIRRLLSNLAEDFICNVDYGDKTQREHYHAVIALKADKINEMKKGYDKKIGVYYEWETLTDLYKYGNYTLQKISFTKTSVTRIGRYINKLSLHAFKVNQRTIMTGRGTRYQLYKANNAPTDFEINDNANQAKIVNSMTESEKETLSNIADLFNGNFDIEE